MPSASRTKSENFKSLNQIEWEELAIDQLRISVRRAANWKSPGPDKLPVLLLKQFTSLQNHMANAF